MKKEDMLTLLQELEAADDTVIEKVEATHHKICVAGRAWDTIPRLNIGSEKKLPIDYAYLYYVWHALITCEDGELEVFLLDYGMGKGFGFYSAFSVDAVLERVALHQHADELASQRTVETYQDTDEKSV